MEDCLRTKKVEKQNGLNKFTKTLGEQKRLVIVYLNMCVHVFNIWIQRIRVLAYWMSNMKSGMSVGMK